MADDAQVGDQPVEPTNNTAQVDEQLTPAEAGTVQPSTSGTQPNDQMAQMLLMMQKTFDEQLKFQREQKNVRIHSYQHLKRTPKLIGLIMMDFTVIILFGKNSGIQSSKVTIYLHQML